MWRAASQIRRDRFLRLLTFDVKRRRRREDEEAREKETRVLKQDEGEGL